MRGRHPFLCLAAFLAVHAHPGLAARAQEPARSPALRQEHFVLEMDAPEPAAKDPAPDGRQAAASVVGLASWRRRALADGFLLECECRFLRSGEDSGEQRVLHVEQLTLSGPRLVWREWGAGSGRSLLAEWSQEGRALRTVEWSRDETPRETLSASQGAVMPLYLVELARCGQAVSGRYVRFDPLSRSLEPVDLRTSYRRSDEGEVVRTVDLARADGTLAGRFEFRGAELSAFQWQEGGLRARRVSAEEYARRLVAPGMLAPGRLRSPQPAQ